MADQKMQIVITALDETQRAFANLKTALGQAQGQFKDLNAHASSSQKSVNSLAGSFALLQAALPVAVITAFTRSVVDAGLAFDRVQSVLKVSTGTAEAAARELQFIRNEANRLGLDAAVTADSYSKFLTAIKGTAVEGEPGRKVFVGISEAMSALKKSSDETSRVFAQIQQSFAKGKLELEDLKIIAEAGVPIFGMLAEAMGKTKPEIMKMISDGKLMADEVWPKVADQMHKTFGVAAVESANSAQGAINKLKNEYNTVLEMGAKEFMPGFTNGLIAIKSAIYPVIAEITRLAMLVDKAGGTLTTFGMIASKAAELLVRFATVGQFGDSFKNMADKFSQWNKMYAEKYTEGDRRLTDLANKSLGLGGVDTNRTNDELATDAKRNAQVKAAEEAARKRAEAAKNASKVKAEADAWTKSGEKWADHYYKEEQSASDSQVNFSIKSQSGTSQKMAQLEKEKQGFIDNWAMRATTEEEYQNRIDQINKVHSESRLKVATDHAKNIKKEAAAASESTLTLQSAKIAEQEAAGTITATEAMQQQIMVMQQKSQLMTDQLSSMPKDTAGEVAAYNSQAEALSRVNTELNSMNKTLRMREGWEGLKQGLQEYADMASNIGQQISDAVKGAFQGLEDAIVNFVKTGKLNFKDLADSIITDLIRIAVRSAITKPLAEAAGSLFSGFFAKGGAFDGGVQKFATGGIVMSPTLFGMAGGAGLMGEAGPEAIMPLARTSSGHLGVRTAGGGQQAMSVQVNVINQSSQNVSAKSGPMQFDGKSFVINTILQDVQNNGPLRGLMAGGGAY